MVLKIINAAGVKVGTNIIVDGVPCTVKIIDISKTGKHGSSKVRIEAVGLLDRNKRIIVKPGHENIPVPIIEKKRAQVLSKDNGTANIMDLETYETFSADISEDVKDSLEEGKQVEYWKIAGKKIIKRTL